MYIMSKCKDIYKYISKTVHSTIDICILLILFMININKYKYPNYNS
jgi:hypothetical protein